MRIEPTDNQYKEYLLYRWPLPHGICTLVLSLVSEVQNDSTISNLEMVKYVAMFRGLRKRSRIPRSGKKKRNILLLKIPLQLVDQKADGESWIPGLSRTDESVQGVFTHHISELFSFQYKEYVRDINFLEYKLRQPENGDYQDE